MIDVNLQDAQVTGLSAQGRFEFAYNAARQTATLAIRATGCRSKRNDFSYDSPITVTETEANDLFNTAKQLLTDAEAWILVNHPSLA